MNGGTGESERYSSTLSQRSYYYALALSDGSVLRVSGEQYTVLSLVVSIWYYILLVLVAALALSLFLASRVSKAIIRPINEIDLEHPEEGDTYEELAPLLGLSDAIVDIVETGTTLKENGLEVVETICDISARLIVNTASLKLRKAEIEELVAQMEQAKKQA